MKVKIFKSSSDTYWYKDDIGKEIEIEMDLKGYPKIYEDKYYMVYNSDLLILIDDCYPIKVL